MRLARDGRAQFGRSLRPNVDALRVLVLLACLALCLGFWAGVIWIAELVLG